MVKGRRFGSRWLTLIASVGIALPLLAMTASSSAGAAPKGGGLPPGLQPTQVNVSNDLTHRYGEPVVMANPKNPNNLVYMSTGPDLNKACEQTDPLCKDLLFGFPSGLLVKNGWQHDHVFVTFDRGRTWAPGSSRMGSPSRAARRHPRHPRQEASRV
jgi:hypothetical protein